jgi:hypothetical protein
MKPLADKAPSDLGQLTAATGCDVQLSPTDPGEHPGTLMPVDRGQQLHQFAQKSAIRS